ncbi:MAG TPA: SMC-Scp complex subunit ScpB [Candidatus Saccharibacteria bacterium]|nr:SMC-Scp complex subunit ScpB [Candidatus Saccharibacteria bacterium]HMT39477.1 SMC-Scp complex subunit ScpB [Candidatus Saccharibacteria bacterium]
MNQNIQLVSAILFLNPNGISLAEIATISQISDQEITKILEILKPKYKNLGLEIVNQDNKYLLLVSRVITSKNDKLLNSKEQLSSSALEVLSIIAYKQPISRSEIEEIRSIGSEQSIRGLLERELIEEVRSKKDGIVHVKYVTTVFFLKQLGIGSLDYLPEKK